MDVYNKIPTKSELEQAIGDKISNKLYDHIIISGGGRIDNEYEWYYFKSKTI